MDGFLLHLLTTAHGAPAYVLVFGVLIACGLGLPLPEDVALLAGGYLSISTVNLGLMIVFALAGILGGDLIVFAAGRRYGQELAHTHWLHRYLTDEKRQRVERYFGRHGQLMVIAARFLPGIRVVTYFTAGAVRMSLSRFLAYDAIAACVSAPLWILVGRRLGLHLLPRAVGWVSQAHWVLLGVAALVGLIVAFLLVRRNGAAPRKTPAIGIAKPPAPPAAVRERTG